MNLPDSRIRVAARAILAKDKLHPIHPIPPKSPLRVRVEMRHNLRREAITMAVRVVAALDQALTVLDDLNPPLPASQETLL